MVRKRIKRLIAFNLRGVSPFLPTPPSFQRAGIGREFKWCREFLLAVNLSRGQQMVKSHPLLAERLLADIPELALAHGGISCGKDVDFAVKLRHGRQTLGHTFEHVLAWAQEKILAAFGEQRNFIWWTRINEHWKSGTLYQIIVFYTGEEPPPAELFGIEGVVCGYFDALFEDRVFLIRACIEDFIEHRTEGPFMPPESQSNSFLEAKPIRRLRDLLKAAVCLFSTS